MCQQSRSQEGEAESKNIIHVHSTLGMESRIVDILRWKCFEAGHVPKGSLLKQNLPIKVMKVVNKRTSSNSGTVETEFTKQTPELGSS